MSAARQGFPSVNAQSSKLDQLFEPRLDKQKASGLFRELSSRQAPSLASHLSESSPVLDFAGNDYLGLSQHAKVKKALQEGVAIYGGGATASHLVSGHHAVHEEFENKLAGFMGFESATLFSSGYMANLGAVQTLVGSGGNFKKSQWTIFHDRLNHASLIDAVSLSGARSKRYRHQDYQHLASLLEEDDSPHKLVISDGVFSMDGDMADLGELNALCNDAGAILMIDDAHGVGAVGTRGRGVCDWVEPSDLPGVLVITFGKAFGLAGACVLGPASLKSAMAQFARTYIYTTATPPAIACGLLASLELISSEEGQQLREQLNASIADFSCRAERVQKRGEIRDKCKSATPIQPLIFGSNEKVMNFKEQLQRENILVGAIRSPTVPKGAERLRVTLNATHSPQDIAALFDALEHALKVQ